MNDAELELMIYGALSLGARIYGRPMGHLVVSGCEMANLVSFIREESSVTFVFDDKERRKKFHKTLSSFNHSSSGEFTSTFSVKGCLFTIISVFISDLGTSDSIMGDASETRHFGVELLNGSLHISRYADGYRDIVNK